MDVVASVFDDCVWVFLLGDIVFGFGYPGGAFTEEDGGAFVVLVDGISDALAFTLVACAYGVRADWTVFYVDGVFGSLLH